MIYTDIIIDATPSATREAFLNFSALPTYHNSYYQSLEIVPNNNNSLQDDIQEQDTPAKPGDKLLCTIDSIAYPAIVEVNSAQEFTWRGYFGWNWVFNGLHRFRFEDVGESTITTSGKTRFVQCEELGGLLAGALWMVGRARMEQGFVRFNEDFKRFVERTSTSSTSE